MAVEKILAQLAPKVKKKMREMLHKMRRPKCTISTTGPLCAQHQNSTKKFLSFCAVEYYTTDFNVL
jgi:hypothetical protein